MRIGIHILIAAILSTHALTAALFGDRIVAKGKGVEVKASDIEETFIAYKASRAATGQPVPEKPEDIMKVETDILDNKIAAQLLLARATDADRASAKTNAANLIEERKKASPSEASFNRQLAVAGLTYAEFEKEVLEQAIIKAVVSREIGSKITVTDAEIEKFYNDNPKFFEEPEHWKIAHIFLVSRNRVTGEELTDEELAQRKVKMEDLLRRARAGEDFGKLAKENSEHTTSKDSGGVSEVARGQMPPEFEAAVASMKPGQISDVIRSRLGFHIIKMLEYTPAKKKALAEMKEKIKDAIVHDQTQKAVPEFIATLRKEAGVEVTLDKEE